MVKDKLRDDWQEKLNKLLASPEIANEAELIIKNWIEPTFEMIHAEYKLRCKLKVEVDYSNYSTFRVSAIPKLVDETYVAEYSDKMSALKTEIWAVVMYLAPNYGFLASEDDENPNKIDFIMNLSYR